jgi:phage repressor protein C with HTH and peptisase S24 domain
MKSPVFVLKISGNSMRPFAMDGDYAISTRVFLRPRIGEVIILTSPNDGKMMIKRVKSVSRTDGEQRYFVEGDNRIRSTDSNTFGSIGRRDVIGKVLFISRKSKAR